MATNLGALFHEAYVYSKSNNKRTPEKNEKRPDIIPIFNSFSALKSAFLHNHKYGCFLRSNGVRLLLIFDYCILHMDLHQNTGSIRYKRNMDHVPYTECRVGTDHRFQTENPFTFARETPLLPPRTMTVF